MPSNLAIAMLICCAELVLLLAATVLCHARLHAWLLRCRRGIEGEFAAEEEGDVDLTALAAALVSARQDLLNAAAQADAGGAEAIGKQIELVRHYTAQVAAEKLNDAVGCELALAGVSKLLECLDSTAPAAPASAASIIEMQPPAPQKQAAPAKPAAPAVVAHAVEKVSEDDIDALAAQIMQRQAERGQATS